MKKLPWSSIKSGFVKNFLVFGPFCAASVAIGESSRTAENRRMASLGMDPPVIGRPLPSDENWELRIDELSGLGSGSDQFVNSQFPILIRRPAELTVLSRFQLEESLVIATSLSQGKPYSIF